MLKVIKDSQLDREEFKTLLEQKLVKDTVFITGNHTNLLVKFFKENYHLSPKEESDVLIISRIYSDGTYMFGLGKKNESLQESLYDEDKEQIPEDIYENLALVIIDEVISRPGKRNIYVIRYVAVLDDEARNMIIDNILEMIFEDKEI